MGKTLLVIARKFNDIIYSINSDEFKYAIKKILLIITHDKSQYYPSTDLFDEVINIYSSDVSWKGQINLLFKLYKIKNRLRCDILCTSNLVLLSNLFLIKISKCSSIVLLEDGYMNYRNDCFDNNYRKDILLQFLGINKKNIFNRIDKTYLLKPEYAKYFFGEKRKLIFNPSLMPPYEGPNLENKTIFIGQPLYITNPDISFKDYNDLVNRIIKEYKIDFYLPHLYASNEKIDCPILQLSNYGITLEVLANLQKFNVVSFSSSLLFTAKLINPEINSTMILHNKLPKIKDIDIFIKCGVELNHLN